jgi:hypothetical protein
MDVTRSRGDSVPINCVWCGGNKGKSGAHRKLQFRNFGDSPNTLPSPMMVAGAIALSRTAGRLDGAPSAEQVNDEDHQGYHEQQMDQASSNMQAEPQEPQN